MCIKKAKSQTYYYNMKKIVIFILETTRLKTLRVPSTSRVVDISISEKQIFRPSSFSSVYHSVRRMSQSTVFIVRAPTVEYYIYYNTTIWCFVQRNADKTYHVSTSASIRIILYYSIRKRRCIVLTICIVSFRTGDSRPRFIFFPFFFRSQISPRHVKTNWKTSTQSKRKVTSWDMNSYIHPPLFAFGSFRLTRDPANRIVFGYSFIPIYGVLYFETYVIADSVLTYPSSLPLLARALNIWTDSVSRFKRNRCRKLHCSRLQWA